MKPCGYPGGEHYLQHLGNPFLCAGDGLKIVLQQLLDGGIRLAGIPEGWLGSSQLHKQEIKLAVVDDIVGSIR